MKLHSALIVLYLAFLASFTFAQQTSKPATAAASTATTAGYASGSF